MKYFVLPKAILSLSLLLSSLAAGASSDVINALRIHCKSGTDVTILLNERPLVTFANNDMVITTHTNVVCYPSDEVQKFTYVSEDEESSSIRHASQLGIVFSFIDDNNLQVNHLAPKSTISLYAVDGKLVDSAQTDSQGCASLQFPKAPGGVYVVKTSSVTFKIRKP